jgi:hypothetical protein
MPIIRLILLCMFALLATTASAADSAKIDWNDKELHWLSYQQGMAKLKQTGQRGILIVYADWCSTCKAYSSFFKKPEVVSALAGLVLMRANKDVEPKISMKYGDDGQYVPRTLALSSNGAILKQAYERQDEFAYFIPADQSGDLIEFLRRVKAAKQ